MKKTGFLISALVALLLTGCNPSRNSSSTPDSSTSSSETTTSSETSSSTISDSSSSSTSIDLNKVLEQLTATAIVFSGDLKLDFYLSSNDALISSSTDVVVTGIGEDYFHREYDSESTGNLETVTYFKGEDGYAVAKVIMPDNQIYDYPYVDSNYEYIDFDSNYFNVLRSLTAENLEIVDETTIQLVNLSEELKSSISTYLTWYSDIPYVNLTFTVDENSVVTGGLFTGLEEDAETTDSSGNAITIDFQASYTFDIVDIQDTNFSIPQPFETKSEHAKLQSLFNELKKGNYTMSVTKTGGAVGALNTPEVWYYASDVLIRAYVFSSGDIRGGGWYQDENGLNSITFDNGVMTGTGTTYTDGSVSEYVSQFTFAPEVFDVNEDGSFTLKTGYGFENYIHYTAPDFAYNFNNYLYYLDEGTYTITVNDDGTAKFVYSYTSGDGYGNTYSGQITLDIYNIGTTSSSQFEYVPYSVPSYESWDDYGEDAVALLKKYLGENATSILPVFNADLVTTYTNWEERDVYQGTGQYLFFYGRFTSATDATNAIEDYQAALVEKGWVADDTIGTGGYRYNDGTLSYQFRIWANSNHLYMNIYEPETIEETTTITKPIDVINKISSKLL